MTAPFVDPHEWGHHNAICDRTGKCSLDGSPVFGSPVSARERPQPDATARGRQEGGDHYRKMTIQPWDVIDQWAWPMQLGFYRGNVLKYIMRAGEKGDAHTDLLKARHYLDKLIEAMSNDDNT